MSDIVIAIPGELKAEIDEASSRNGVPAEEWVRRTLKAQLRVERFHAVRERVLQDLDSRGIHFTEEDVFSADS